MSFLREEMKITGRFVVIFQIVQLIETNEKRRNLEMSGVGNSSRKHVRTWSVPKLFLPVD